jgi:hypothetical protein
MKNNKNLLLAASVLLLSGCSASAAFGVTILALGAYQAESSGSGLELKDGEPRRPPPMAPDRKVNVVDCSQPIDYSLGNIRCK